MVVGLAQLVQFPCAAMPEEPGRARLLGIYPQRQEGLFFQRVRLPGGRIRPEQWRGLAALAATHTPGYPLHVTTRQDVELHGVRPEEVSAIQNGVAALGLSCAGACGDTVRNVTFCPSNGLRRGTWDVSELAGSIQSCVESISWITDLPRKFKISVCGCYESCTRPWINDLGLVANHDGTFRAVVAGSLGSTPATGIVVDDALAVDRILPLVMALLRLFHAEGDRTRRHRARLRHVRERLGDAAFKDRVAELFQEELAGGSYGAPRVWQVDNDTPLQAHLHLPLGDITPEAAIELGRAVEEARAELRIGLAHDLLLHGPRPLVLSPALWTWSAQAPVVACPGSTWCSKGIVDARGAAERIGRRLSRPADLSVAVSGCPNNCSQAAVASIGLVGRIQRIESQPVQGFRVLVGGGEGRDPGLARELHPFVAADDIDEAVGWIVEEYERAVDRNAATDFNAFLSENFPGLAETLDRRYGAPARRKCAAASQ
jgi:sulfite reductase beta subunit-like hemoprotein